MTVRPVRVPASVEHPTRYAGGLGSNPGLFCHYFSHLDTFGAMPTPGTLARGENLVDL